MILASCVLFSFSQFNWFYIFITLLSWYKCPLIQNLANVFGFCLWRCFCSGLLLCQRCHLGISFEVMLQKDLFKKKLFICFVSVCLWVCTCHTAFVEFGRQLFRSFHPLSAGDQTQAFGLGGKPLYPLSHPMGWLNIGTFRMLVKWSATELLSPNPLRSA